MTSSQDCYLFQVCLLKWPDLSSCPYFVQTQQVLNKPRQEEGKENRVAGRGRRIWVLGAQAGVQERLSCPLGRDLGQGRRAGVGGRLAG